jgi:Protein of unknown function (DUF3126)
VKKDELAKLEAYLRKTFGSKNLTVRPRPKINDSAEVYIGDDFVATITEDREDGELTYQLAMAILEMDLEGGGDEDDD